MEQSLRWRIGIGAAVVLVGGAVVGAVVTQTASSGGGSGSVSVEQVEPSASATTIVVDVQGAVAEPGVYLLAEGTRIVDAIARAGGAVDHADTSTMNLAQPLVDGTQVLVPREGEAPPVASGAGGGAGAGAAGGLVSVNAADEATLDTLPRIGPALANAIVTHRTEHGPFRDLAELEDVPGIGPALLAHLEPLVTL